jgi:fatty acid-binding protein DegV
VEKESGKYATHGQEMTLRRALDKLIQVVGELVPNTKKMRVQLLHGNNLPAVDMLREKISQVFDCHWETTVPVAPVLGAHTGPSLVGLAVAPMELFSGLP